MQKGRFGRPQSFACSEWTRTMPDSIGWKLLAAAFAATMLSAAPAEAWPWIYAGPPIAVPPPVVVAPLAVSWGGRSPSEGLSTAGMAHQCRKEAFHPI